MAMRFDWIILAGCVVATSVLLLGCTTPSPQHEISGIVCAEAPPPHRAMPLDLGLLKIALPEGYHAVQSRSVHGGIAFDMGGRGIDISNGYWDASSFRDEKGTTPSPACEIETDGIPVNIYVLSSVETGERVGITSVFAIVKFPVRPDDEMVMQSLVSAKIRNGDKRHATEVIDLIRSIRKGDPDSFVHAPGEKRRSRNDG